MIMCIEEESLAFARLQKDRDIVSIAYTGKSLIEQSVSEYCRGKYRPQRCSVCP